MALAWFISSKGLLGCVTSWWMAMVSMYMGREITPQNRKPEGDWVGPDHAFITILKHKHLL
jgi:hypothetical protein